MKKLLSVLAIFSVLAFAGCSKKQKSEKPYVKKEHKMKKDKYVKHDAPMKKKKSCKSCHSSVKKDKGMKKSY